MRQGQHIARIMRPGPNGRGSRRRPGPACLGILLGALLLGGAFRGEATGLQLKNLPDTPTSDRFPLPTDLVWPAAVGEGDICLWHEDKFAAVSFGVDDNIVTEHGWWTDKMNQYGWKMTWFTIAGGTYMCQSHPTYGCWADFVSLANMGHKVDSHTLTHVDNMDTWSDAALAPEYQGSHDLIVSNVPGARALTLAYAFGKGKRYVAADTYIAARGVIGGINQANRIDYLWTKSNSKVGINSNFVDAILLGNSPWSPGTPEPNNKRGWSNAHFHQLNDDTNNVAIDLAYLQTKEDQLWIGTFSEVAQYGEERDTAVLTVDSVTSSQITFTLSDDMDDTLYDFPLTVKFRVDNGWNSVHALQAGLPVNAWLVEHGGNKYALVKAVPDGGQVLLGEGELAPPAPDGTILIIRGPAPPDVLWVDADSTAPDPDGSPLKPYPTIQGALDAAATGALRTVRVRGGTYREQLTLPSGSTNQPVILEGAPGERAIVSGLTPVTGWVPFTDSVYTAATTLTNAPARLFAGFERQPPAREPNEGWWAATAVNNVESNGAVSLFDTVHLTNFPYAVTNASAYVWTQSGSQFYTCRILGLDPAAGRLAIQRLDPGMVLTAGDKYWIQNQRTLIDQPGEWASEPEGGVFRIYFHPVDTNDLARTETPSGEGVLISGFGVTNIQVRGIEVAGGGGDGISLKEAAEVEVADCILHDNVSLGCRVRDSRDITLAGNVVLRNGDGVKLTGCDGATVEENEISRSEVDGLVIDTSSSNLVVRRNYLHDHMLWGHPDNSQLFGTVNNVKFQDNLFVSGGQSLIAQESRDGEVTGNTFVGSGANMLIFAHGNAGYYAVRSNTLACAGYAAMNMTWRDYDVKENVFMNGNSDALYSIDGITNYTGDYNLFWNGERLVDPNVLVSDGPVFHKSLADFQSATGQDLNSAYGNPLFVNAPIAFNVLDETALTDATRDTFTLRKIDTFQVGDHVELTFDGVVRTVTVVNATAITVAPPLDEKPLKAWLVANWGTNDNFEMDLRLQAGSPGATLGPGGRPVGSSVSIPSYKAGDFDGDGQRDIPAIPPDLNE